LRENIIAVTCRSNENIRRSSGGAHEKKGKRCEDGDELITKIHGFLTPLGKRKEGIKDRMNSVYQKN
jgi:hypothetical protein